MQPVHEGLSDDALLLSYHPMPTFVYDAIRADGTRVQGELEARTKSEAHAQLDRDRLQPLSLSSREPTAADGKSESDAPPASTGPVRLNRNQVIFFTEELSDLLDAGLQLEGALRIIEERQQTPVLRGVATALRQHVRDGGNFSDALRKVSPSFGELYCSLVSAGEISGALPRILKRQVKYLTVMQDLRSQIVQALIYPAFIVGCGALLMVLFMGVLVPQLVVLFENAEKKMPAATRVLIGMSTAVTQYWWLILGMLLGGWLAFYLVTKKPEGRLWWDRVRLGLPLIGPVLTSGFLAQFCQTLSNLVGNGLPLLTGLKLMERATPNTWIRQRLGQVIEIVGEGGSFSRAMRKVGGFPDLFVDLVAVGEQTGDLSNSLEKAATRYEKEMNRRIERITALIQPVVIVVIALLVGLVVYSIITSIFEAIGGMRGGGARR